MNRAGCGEHSPNAINPHIHVPSGKKGLSVSYHQTELKPPEQEDQDDDDDAPCFSFYFMNVFILKQRKSHMSANHAVQKKDTTDVCFTHVRPPGKYIHIIIEIRT